MSFNVASTPLDLINIPMARVPFLSSSKLFEIDSVTVMLLSFIWSYDSVFSWNPVPSRYSRAYSLVLILCLKSSISFALRVLEFATGARSRPVPLLGDGSCDIFLGLFTFCLVVYILYGYYEIFERV
ncbi:hypothetical protein M422DRAFT_23406 [Sphaerobolus stellatus SS14]|nr:hypothetical protein M422DRAFT_23406 [Sphaerobolus stellatus SS14]